MPKSRNSKSHKTRVAKRVKAKKDKMETFQRNVNKIIAKRKLEAELKKHQEEQIKRNPTNQLFIQEEK